MSTRPALNVQKYEAAIRTADTNLNYWYPVAWSCELKPGQMLSVTLWGRRIVICRTFEGSCFALEDACLHKGVALSKGALEGTRVVCPYHGWQFDAAGQCQQIPYLPEGHKCPRSRIPSFPTRDRYGIVWVFPGDTDAAADTPMPEVPEYGDPNWLMVQIPGHFKAHFSICNENTMDVFHGHLHKDIQGWFDPVLLSLEKSDSRVLADYQVSYQGRMAVVLGLAKRADEVCHRTVSIEYNYPHFKNTMGDLSSLYLMRLPVGPRETRSFSLMFLKLGLPGWLWRPFRKPAAKLLWRLMLKRFLEQDTEMMESEQENYDLEPDARRVEINPAITALRRVIAEQRPESEVVS